MTEPISVEEFLIKSRTIPVADVRTPAEYEKAHIPGAVLFPLFNDLERAEVGTLYVQERRTAAVLKGLELTGPRLEAMARRGLEIAGGSAADSGGSLLLYCWRGGMRSASVAWLMEKVGIRCYTLENGYKAYRNHLLGFFEHLPHSLNVLGGLTGSGKTERLLQMAEAGEQ
ncbi:MAG: rhodanese-like domain-containing protein, partial [Bacteroidales bacterium]